MHEQGYRLGQSEKSKFLGPDLDLVLILVLWLSFSAFVLDILVLEAILREIS